MKRLILLSSVFCLLSSAVWAGPVPPFVTLFWRGVLDDPTAADSRTSLGLGTGDSPTFAGITIVIPITEFSTDGTLSGNSDSAIPTEKAVKTYVDAVAGGGPFAPLELTELTGDPAKPAEGEMILWMTDGTGFLGDDGDLMIASTAGGVTNRAILWDFSAATGWGENVIYAGENVIYAGEQVIYP